MTRTYVAATLELLRDWHAAGLVPSSAGRVPAEGDDEEAEYAALMTAADLSADLLAGSGRRCVVVAETGDPDGELLWRQVVAVHVDTEDDADPDDDLAWFAVQEVPHLV
ncbi:DUF6912 family protein [uncultured Nocardioides sp.]|uniref:DUF6912 family protein n=1 Tax=uncultured Nocardioides sp. TaxID=198441 RepID=UPI0025D73249|nr:hypothetical protein [uncultured Nocardioides sp.]